MLHVQDACLIDRVNDVEDFYLGGKGGSRCLGQESPDDHFSAVDEKNVDELEAQIVASLDELKLDKWPVVLAHLSVHQRLH